jgi:lysophospholipase L1-like esterase
MRLLPALLASFTAANALSAAEPLPDFHLRGGLPRFLAAAAAGQEIRIAYFGGSITAAPGWRVKSREDFQRRWPAAKFSEINAAIGGTGSDLGAFRCRRDVLAGNPDLVFIEFAVNDGGAPPERIHRAVEGIVRQIRAHRADTDICLVYTLAHGMLDEYRAGRIPRSAAAMEQIAAHYQLPSIFFGPEVARRVDAGRLIFKGSGQHKEENGVPVFSNDAVHPHVETGHAIYAEGVARAFDALLAAPPGPGPARPEQPFVADHWEAARIVDLTANHLSGEGWTALDRASGLGKNFASRLPTLWQASRPGDAVAFSFQGRMVGLFDLLGPDGGQVRVTLDGADKGLRPRFDAYCTYHRLAPLWLAEGLPAGRHTVRVELTAEPLDKAAILAQRREAMNDPARFAPLRWQVGSILVLGEVE